MSDVFISANVPIRIAGSHGQNVPGFKSTRDGVFVSIVPEPPHFTKQFLATDVTVLAVALETFAIEPPGANGWQKLEVAFKERQTKESVIAFLERLSTALTALSSAGQRDPWYGNLVVEMDWFSLQFEKPRTAAMAIDARGQLAMTSEDFTVLTAEKIEALGISDLTEIFVDGMRANQPKSKYLNWFIPLEELENLASTDFSHLFTPLFPKTERSEIAKASKLTGGQLNRLKNFLGSPNHTVQNRNEKLSTILHAIGICELTTIKETKVPVDVTLCGRLTQGRNSLAHKGTKVDEDLLYNVLFPLSQRVLAYLDGRQRYSNRSGCA